LSDLVNLPFGIFLPARRQRVAGFGSATINRRPMVAGVVHGCYATYVGRQGNHLGLPDRAARQAGKIAATDPVVRATRLTLNNEA